jgi:hypothetical protein
MIEGLGGGGGHLFHVDRWKEVLWGAQRVDRSAWDKRTQVNSATQDRVLREVGKDDRATDGGGRVGGHRGKRCVQLGGGGVACVVRGKKDSERDQKRKAGGDVEKKKATNPAKLGLEKQ